ncbi:hypothetical protein DRQ36_04515 [bacterium]|nr:MAG: hypothetical protein DRQ36_04515 [bacterium]
MFCQVIFGKKFLKNKSGIDKRDIEIIDFSKKARNFGDIRQASGYFIKSRILLRSRFNLSSPEILLTRNIRFQPAE